MSEVTSVVIVDADEVHLVPLRVNPVRLVPHHRGHVGEVALADRLAVDLNAAVVEVRQIDLVAVPEDRLRRLVVAEVVARSESLADLERVVAAVVERLGKLAGQFLVNLASIPRVVGVDAQLVDRHGAGDAEREVQFEGVVSELGKLRNLAERPNREVLRAAVALGQNHRVVVGVGVEGQPHDVEPMRVRIRVRYLVGVGERPRLRNGRQRGRPRDDRAGDRRSRRSLVLPRDAQLAGEPFERGDAVDLMPERGRLDGRQSRCRSSRR